MGEVYLAQDTKLNRRVAIKVLPDLHASDSDRVARFHREAQAIAALNHAGIAAIYDLVETSSNGATEGQSYRYLVLELVEGETLADRLRQGPLPVEETIQIAKQIVEAIEAAHEKGICHRDLKPANIKITPEGAVKVLDFGLAKFLESRASGHPDLTQSPTLSLAGTLPGVVLGTAGYMSPEQAKGFDADHRSDIFSFGCVFYEMLAGRQAFNGETVSEILASVLKTDVDFAMLPARLNPRLVETLRRCLEKNPKKRWQAIGDVRLELEAFGGHGIVAEAVAVQVADQRATWKWTTALVAAALVGAGVAAFVTWRIRPEPARSITRFSVRLGEGQQFSGNSRRLLTLSNDGRSLVYVANNRLYLRPTSGFESRPIAGSEGFSNLVSPAVSPDGDSIAFWAGDRMIRRVRTDGGPSVSVCELEGQPYGISWDTTGILFGLPGKGIFRVSPNGGAAEAIAPTAADEIASNPQMLPGGRAVLFSLKKLDAPWNRAQIVAQPLDGGPRKTILNGGSDGRYIPTGHLLYAVGGTLFAMRFDADSLTASGDPVPVLEGVRRAGSLAADGTGTAQFSSSKTGTLVYLPGPANMQGDMTDLALFDRQGRTQPLKLPLGPYAAPRNSQDGKWIVFERLEDKEASIWRYELAGNRAPQRLTFSGNNRAPVWSPDGEWIAFQSDREGDLAIFRQRADGSGVPERLTKPDPGTSHTLQSWSPDGAQLLLSVQKSGDQPKLFTMSLKDRQVVAYGDASAREAVFSPNGRWVVYQTGTPFGNQVYLEPFPRSGAKYLVPTERSVGHPFWSPKGDEIIMNVTSTNSMAVSVTTTPTVAFGRPMDFARLGRQEGNPTSARRNVDMMPDGEHVVGVLFPGSTGTDQTPQINVVLNWFDEITQKFPAR